MIEKYCPIFYFKHFLFYFFLNYSVIFIWIVTITLRINDLDEDRTVRDKGENEKI